MNIFIGVKWFIAMQCIWAASCLIDSEAQAAESRVRGKRASQSPAGLTLFANP